MPIFTRPWLRHVAAASIAAAVAGMPSARAQQFVNDDPAMMEAGQAYDPGSGLFLRRMTARAQADALHWRFGPRAMALARPGAPQKAAPGITPAAGNGAGPLGHGWTIWSTSQAAFLKDRRPARASKGHSLSFTAGLDRRLGGRLTAGVSTGIVHARLKTAFKGGHTHNTTISITPYFNHAITGWLSLDVSGGYVYSAERLTRIVPWAASGKTHADGYLLSAALSASKWLDVWLLSGRAGVIVTRDRWRAYTESDGTFVAARTERLTQAVVEASASLWLDPVMPYATVAYNRDLAGSGLSGSDRDDWTVTTGIALYGSGVLDGLTADLSASIVLGRNRQRNATMALGLRWTF